MAVSDLNPAIFPPASGTPGTPGTLAAGTGDDSPAALAERRERLAAIGEMTARLAHQLRTPLASALLYASQLAAGDERRHELTGKLTRRLHELGQMTEDLLGFARGVHGARAPVAVAALFEDVAGHFAPRQAGQSIRIAPVAGRLTVEAEPVSLRGALINLVENALQACTAPPRIELAAALCGDRIRLIVSDNGGGIRPEALPRLFEPFFTTRPQGTGLGLAIVRAVADAHGGEVQVETGPGGSTFALCLPHTGAQS